MPRENKQERTIRLMTDQVAEHMADLKNMVANPASKEADVERWAERVLKSCLGFTAIDGYVIRSQQISGKMRPDLVIYKGEKPIFVVEVKKLGFDLGKTDFRSGKTQLSEYLHGMPEVRWGFLTNGTEWKLFDFSDKGCRGIDVITVDLKNDADEIDLSKKGIEESTYELFDLHETCFADGTWDETYREASAFSPDSISRAILSADVVKAIAKTIRGKHEFKANPDALMDRLQEVLIQGLDDVDLAWSEVKKLELNKFVKGQKRSMRTKRRATKKGEETPTMEEAIAAEKAADAKAPSSAENAISADTAKADPIKVA